MAGRGLFVTVEGVDFCGKSTLVQGLGERFRGTGMPVRFSREPGGTPAAERIRELLLDPRVEMDPWTEAYLYAAARADHVRLLILPALERGEVVICERFLDSSLAYQGCGRGLGMENVRRLNLWAVGDLVPDITFYLRVGEEERLRRARASGVPPDRIERSGGAFLRRVEEGFEEIARREPGRIRILDGTLPPSELAEMVVRELRGYTRGG
ncbi:dTMP kinase [Rubrobacter xylanophilus]|uniref:dTMP kinase n=1 Tax=Rubrobacter xylanophilus TaxID=49319 RepID=UPI0022778744|nr:dTMP kinase [Rubrobacter xylanophilus]